MHQVEFVQKQLPILCVIFALLLYVCLCDLCLFVCLLVLRLWWQAASVSGCRWHVTVSRICRTGWIFSPNKHTLQLPRHTCTSLSPSATQ